MPVEVFEAEAKKWIETAKHPRWNRHYTELTYQPMLEVLQYLRDNGFRTYIVTGGGQDFVRVYAQQAYGIPPEYGYGKNGKPFLTKEPKLLLNDNNAGKPEGIHLEIGRRPRGIWQLDRRSANAGVHGSRRWRAVDDVGAARRCAARIRLWPGAGTPRYEGRHLYAGALRRGEERQLDGHQHEERLEAHFCLRLERDVRF